MNNNNYTTTEGRELTPDEVLAMTLREILTDSLPTMTEENRAWALAERLQPIVKEETPSIAAGALATLLGYVLKTQMRRRVITKNETKGVH